MPLPLLLPLLAGGMLAGTTLGMTALLTPKTEAKQQVTQQNEQIIINKNLISAVSETTNKQISNTIIKDAKACSADINNNQEITIKNLTTTGGFNYTSNQKQKAALTFSCVQSTLVRNKAKGDIVALIANNLATKATSEALALLAAKVDNEAKVSAGAVGSLTTDQNVNGSNRYRNETDFTKNIKNVLNNIVENNFSSETVSKCISQVNNNQNITLQELKVQDGNTVIVIDQDQAADVITDCIQKSDIGGDIMNAVVSSFDAKVEDSTSSVSIQEQELVAKQKTIAEGMAISGLSGACCCCILVIASCGFLVFEFEMNKKYFIMSSVVLVIIAIIVLVIYILDKQKKDENK